MTKFHLILRNLVYFRAANLAVALGMAVATAVLTGALMVGDSVRGSLRALAVQLSPADPVGTATLRVRPGTGWALRRLATAERTGDGGWDALEVPYAGRWTMAEDVASFGPDVVVDGPPELREAVLVLLHGAAGAA